MTQAEGDATEQDTAEDSDERDESHPVERAPTRQDTPNPYRLQLSSAELETLQGALGARSMHRLVGSLCALASVPQPVAPSAWLGELADAQPALRALEALLLQAYNDVFQRCADSGFAWLVPDSEDEAACAEWAQGYSHYMDQVDVRFRNSETVVNRGFEIHCLAGQPDSLELLDELPEADTVEESLAIFRERLVETVSTLHRRWLGARSAPATVSPKTALATTGRNDPCICGSGKKFKRCCALKA